MYRSFSWLGDGFPELARHQRLRSVFSDSDESDPVNQKADRAGVLPDRVRAGMAWPALRAGLVHCYSDHSRGETIAANVAADGDVGSICEVREAKEV
jgi:hypothetical protein